MRKCTCCFSDQQRSTFSGVEKYLKMLRNRAGEFRHRHTIVSIVASPGAPRNGKSVCLAEEVPFSAFTSNMEGFVCFENRMFSLLLGGKFRQTLARFCNTALQRTKAVASHSCELPGPVNTYRSSSLFQGFSY